MASLTAEMHATVEQLHELVDKLSSAPIGAAQALLIQDLRAGIQSIAEMSATMIKDKEVALDIQAKALEDSEHRAR